VTELNYGGKKVNVSEFLSLPDTSLLEINLELIARRILLYLDNYTSRNFLDSFFLHLTQKTVKIQNKWK